MFNIFRRKKQKDKRARSSGYQNSTPHSDSGIGGALDSISDAFSSIADSSYDSGSGCDSGSSDCGCSGGDSGGGCGD